MVDGASAKGVFTDRVVHEFPLRLKMGTHVSIEVRQEGIGVGLRLETEQGQVLLDLDRAQGHFGLERLTFVAPALGRYRILLRPVGVGRMGGRYAFQVADERPATPEDRHRADAFMNLSQGEMEAGLTGDIRESAQTFYAKAADEFRALAAWSDEAYSRRRWAALLASMSKRPEAFTQLEAALQAARRARDQVQEGWIHADLAPLYRRFGRLPEADHELDQALTRAESLNDPLLKAQALRYKSILSNQMGVSDEAVENSQEAMEILQDEQRPDLVGDLMATQSAAYAALGRSAQAMDSARCGLEIARRHHDERGQAENVMQIGWLYYLAEQPQEALRRYGEALALSDRIGWTEASAAILDRRGSALSWMKRFGPARSAYTEALRNWQKIEDRRFEALTTMNLAILDVDEGQRQAALDALDAALKNLPGDQDPDAKAFVQIYRAHILLKDGKLRETLKDVNEALATIENLRAGLQARFPRASYLATRHSFYELKVEAQMQLHDREPAGEHHVLAFEAEESGRARALADGLAERGLAPQTVSLGQAQRLLDDDTLLLVYALGESRGFVWLIGRDLFEVHSLPGREAINLLVKDFHAALQKTAENGQVAATGAKLGEILLGGVAERLGHKRLVVVRDELLQYLPFAALRVPGSEAWLVDDHEIVYAPSVLVIEQLRARARTWPVARRATLRPAAIFADPVFDAHDPRLPSNVARTRLPERLQLALEDVEITDLRRLPFTADEARYIRGLAGPDALDVRGFDATVQRVLEPDSALGKRRFLHFATHGLLNARNPQLSGLLMSVYGRDGQIVRDSFLLARDIESQLNLHADLVTLSACKTALGEELRGEGLIGLTHAFLKAGATSVLVSLWNVREGSTFELMRHFYDAYLTRGYKPAKALREAQLALRRDPQFSAPVHWAAFVLEGDW